MKYKFAILENEDLQKISHKDFVVFGKTNLKKVIVLDIPPQRRNILFLNSQKQVIQYFIQLPRMHFYSFLWPSRSFDYSVFFDHSIVLFEKDQYFIPPFTNIDLSTFRICGIGKKYGGFDLDIGFLSPRCDTDSNTFMYDSAITGLNSFYDTVFTMELAGCLRNIINKKYNIQCEHQGLLIYHQIATAFFEDWSDATKKGKNFDIPLLPMHNNLYELFTDKLKFQ